MSGGPKKFIITDKHIKQSERLAAQGLTMEQIASVIGIGTSTLYFKQEEYPELQEAIKRGRHKGIATVTNKLFERASQGHTTEMLFYLKNRAPKEWCEAERQAAQASEPAKVKVEVVSPKKKSKAKAKAKSGRTRAKPKNSKKA